MPPVTEPREEMVARLIRLGHGTIDEILAASFGEWPPKGLDIIGTNHRRVDIVPIYKMNAGDVTKRFSPKRWARNLYKIWSLYGEGNQTGKRVIGLHPYFTSNMAHFFGSKGSHVVLGHELLHVVQGDHFYRAAETFGNENASRIKAKGKPDAVAATEDVFYTYADQNLFRRMRNTISSFVLGTPVQDGVEIQAWIHEICMAGYPKWGRLPSNREELFVALDDAGLEMPKAIERQLRHSKTIVTTRHIFANKLNGASGSTGKLLRLTQKTLTQEGQTYLWDKTYPSLYANIIEMLGDRPGRARFNLGHNDFAKYREQTSLSAQLLPGGQKELSQRADKLVQNGRQAIIESSRPEILKLYDACMEKLSHAPNTARLRIVLATNTITSLRQGQIHNYYSDAETQGIMNETKMDAPQKEETILFIQKLREIQTGQVREIKSARQPASGNKGNPPTP